MHALPLLAAVCLCGSAQTLTTARPLPPLIVISDIDDTIKDTRVITAVPGEAVYRKNYAHLAGDPFRPWQPVDGMAARYRTWSAGTSVAFIYLSKGPWWYRIRLSGFLRANRFPPGPLDLNPRFPFSGRDYKSAPLQKVIRSHPGSTFVLVGDSGENDPEVYGRIAEQFPDRVRRVFIRDVTPRNAPSRLAAAFAGLPRTRWQLFTGASQLPTTPLARPPKATATAR